MYLVSSARVTKTFTETDGYRSDVVSGIPRCTILCSVVTGRKQVLTRSDSSITGPDPGYDSVRGNRKRHSVILALTLVEQIEGRVGSR